MVALTWWIITGTLAFYYRPELLLSMGAWLQQASVVVITVIIGAIAGCFAMVFWIAGKRAAIKASLVPSQLRGMTSTIGPVPVLYDPPRAADHDPSLKDVPDVPDGFVAGWMDRHEAEHPLHVALVRTLLRIYEANRDLPATHVVGGHGGRSLLEHSLLCSYLMAEDLAKDYSYNGTVYLPGKHKIKIELANPNYRFDPTDPVILIIGLAHDIGKIESFTFREVDGRRVPDGMLPQHDMIGSRMLARMPEFWALPWKDIQAILAAVAHYHRPMDLPMAPDHRALDDRSIALMELLIKADRQAGAIENHGRKLTPEEEARAMTAEDTGESIDATRLYEEFCELLLEDGRVDGASDRSSIGTYATVKGANTPLLVLHEETVRAALSARLRVDQNIKDGAGRYQLTNLLLEEIAARESLRTSHKIEGIDGVDAGVLRHYKPVNALWRASFFVHGSSGRQAKHIMDWPAAILLTPDCVPALRGRLSTNKHWIVFITDGLNKRRYAQANAWSPGQGTGSSELAAAEIADEGEAPSTQASIASSADVAREVVNDGESRLPKLAGVEGASIKSIAKSSAQATAASQGAETPKSTPPSDSAIVEEQVASPAEPAPPEPTPPWEMPEPPGTTASEKGPPVETPLALTAGEIDAAEAADLASFGITTTDDIFPTTSKPQRRKGRNRDVGLGASIEEMEQALSATQRKKPRKDGDEVLLPTTSQELLLMLMQCKQELVRRSWGASIAALPDGGYLLPSSGLEAVYSSIPADKLEAAVAACARGDPKAFYFEAEGDSYVVGVFGHRGAPAAAS